MKFTGRNIKISPKAKLGKNVKIGDNTTIYDNVEIGDNTIISNDCHIGEPLTDYYRDDNYELGKTIIGANGLIRSHSIIYETNIIGNHFVTGHRIMIRPSNVIGNHCSVGNNSELHGKAELGNYVRIHSDVCVCEYSKIANFVWIFPGTILSNGVNPPGDLLLGPEIGAYTVVAVNTVILPGVKIGEHCLIGASSVVTKNVNSYSLVIGSPAKYIKDVRDIKAYGKEVAFYPWPNSVKKGMPWEKEGFEKWVSSGN